MAKQNLSPAEIAARNAKRAERESALINAVEHIVGGHLIEWQRGELIKAVRQHSSGQPIKIDLPDGRVYTP